MAEEIKRPPHSGIEDAARKPSPPPDPARPVADREINGPKGLEPTRYGDWEKNGRCIDF
ncbi:MAG: DUF1674 domain-containing protein [Methylococcales bacterium]|nr:DUF1674 domain-containing protein [Methylococcales bacterium]